MSGKTTGLSALETRKQLLLLESELNRAHLINEWRAVKNGVRHWTDQARAVGSLAGAAAQISTSVAGFFRGFTRSKPAEDGRPSLITTIFKGARAGADIWSALRSGRS